ncbi:uncharacterized protein LOC119066008 [Bradysia coprophila]|uniref:uncharacterized protein LOC119066008 n=1 Tax=Bradysia coprophila TaxID=38358 RepID=UPI00187DD6AE|nr:uncharacterized protein LOC119066008 [Bradysia coprophila]
MYVEVPMLSAYLYMLQILIGTTDSILNAVIVDLYPTNVRATAMAIGSVAGRLGSVFFAYVIGLLLDYHCSEALVMTFSLYILCAFLVIFIPNIHKRPEKKTVSSVGDEASNKPVE